MSTLWEAISSLQPVIDTVSAEDIISDPETVETRYKAYSRLFFPHEAVKRVEDKLIKEIKAGRSVAGYISGEFGYGKTATAVYLWRRCLDAGICSVPPFLFRSLSGMMDAVTGWVRNALEHRNRDLIPSLEELHERFRFRSHEEMAERISREKAIPLSKAKDIVRDYIARSRDLMNASILVQFLAEVTDIVLESGMKGLLVFADELQEFIRSEEFFREQAQRFSELVKGLRAKSGPLGIIFTMPPPTKMVLEEQTRDVMDRLREKEIFIELEGAYTRDFPEQIWRYACRSFNAEESLRIIPPETLDALGQICVRGDLSNGPRTVIAVFKRAILHWQSKQTPYTPLDMMEDYLNGRIVFEGREQKISSILSGLMDIRPVQQNPEYQRALKLMAAFPNGVPRETARRYGLEETILDLAEREGFIGKHIIQLPEGYALVELIPPSSRPGRLVEELLNRFRSRWFSASSPEEKLEVAKLAFISGCIEHLFPRRTQGGRSLWSGHPDLNW
ncbi:hypothetical protein DRP77_11935 [Candidatus Poribacteria bacterium]|nr:MAG: hypothetical protein DRP77_11935 [Candidatus Poribacteria bacterium]